MLITNISFSRKLEGRDKHNEENKTSLLIYHVDKNNQIILEHNFFPMGILTQRKCGCSNHNGDLWSHDPKITIEFHPIHFWVKEMFSLLL